MKGKQRKIVESREYRSWERGEVKTVMTEDNTTKETADRET